LVIESYPALVKGKPYIFASTHYFSEDVIAAIATIDRNVYALFGTTDQIKHNPQVYIAYLNGLIYVDKRTDKSRKDAVKKMEYVLNNGSSVLLYPEGVWNNTENQLVQTLFAGPYTLSKDTGCEVVPLSIYFDEDHNKVYARAGNPMDLSTMEKKAALEKLRDALATMMYSQIEEHSTILTRDKLTGDFHTDFMESRKNEYNKQKWHGDVWDEEITMYKDKNIAYANDVRASFDDVKITEQNANIMGPILVKRLEDQKYDFTNYMHNNWNK
jgi:L-rhamnose mutarotase